MSRLSWARRSCMRLAAVSAPIAPHLGPSRKPNSAITPSPMNLSRCPPDRLDGAAHFAEIAVEQEHGVERQPVLGQAGEAAQIGEQDRDLDLAAGMEVVALERARDAEVRRHQRRQLEIGGRSDLAGEPDVGAWRRSARARASRRRSAEPGSRCRRRSAPGRCCKRPRPPHTEACGMPDVRLISSNVMPGTTLNRPAARIAEGHAARAGARRSRARRARTAHPRAGRRAGSTTRRATPPRSGSR